MKKYLGVILMVMFSYSANAQMNDMLGVLAIDGALTSSEAQGVGQMQRALSAVQVQQGLAELNMEIQTKYMGNYGGLTKSGLSFGGFDGLEWNVGSVSGSEYYIELSGADSALCYQIKLNGGAKRSVVNNGSDCQGANNTIRLFY